MADTHDPSEEPQHRATPARLPLSLEASLAELEFPDLEAIPELNLYCVAWVYANGRIADSHCLDYDDLDIGRLRNSVHKLLSKTQLSPAMVNGEPEDLELYFRIAFLKNDDVRVFPNWGHDVERYGPSYEAPQRYDLSERYPSSCDYYVGISLTPIDENGRVAGEPQFVTSLRRADRSQKCVANMSKYLERGKYIPAQFDGNPVPAIHAEIWQRWDLMKLNLQPVGR